MNIDKNEIIKVIKEEMESEQYKKTYALDFIADLFTDSINKNSDDEEFKEKMNRKYVDVKNERIKEIIRVLTHVLITLKKQNVIELLEIIEEVKEEKGEN